MWCASKRNPGSKRFSNLELRERTQLEFGCRRPEVGLLLAYLESTYPADCSQLMTADWLAGDMLGYFLHCAWM